MCQPFFMQCPQCGHPLEADFGVATCLKCQAVLFVDMDGNVQLSENASQSSGLVRSSLEIDSSSMTAEAPPYQDNWLEQSPGENHVQSAFPEQSSSDSEMNPGEFSEREVMPEESSMDLAAIEAQPDVQFTEGEPNLTEAPATESNDLSSVSKYANSDQAYGPLMYSVTIEEIDTREIRQQVLEALSDQKFQWDTKELGKRIKSGRLKLENLNPVKASVLIHRLQDVPVKVKWIQNVYS